MGVSPSQDEGAHHSSLPRQQAGPRKTNIGKEAVSELKTQVISLLSKKIQGLGGIAQELSQLLDEEFLTQMLVNLSMQAGLLHLDKSSAEYKGQSEMILQAVMQQVLSETLLPPFYRLFAVKVRFIDTIEEAVDEQATQFAENYQQILQDVKVYQQFCQDFFLKIFEHIHTHDRTDEKLISFAVSSAFFNPSIKSSANSQASKRAKCFIFDFFRLFVRAHASFENDLKMKLPGLRSPEIQTSQQIHKFLKKSQFLSQAQEQIKKITAVTQRTNFLKTILILSELLTKYYELALLAIDGNNIETASQRLALNINFLYCLHTPGMFSLCSFVDEYLGFILPSDVAHRLTLINISYMKIKQYLDSPESYQNEQKIVLSENKTATTHAYELTLLSSPLDKEQTSPISEVSTLETDNSSKKNDSPFNFGDTPQGNKSKTAVVDEAIPQTRCFSV